MICQQNCLYGCAVVKPDFQFGRTITVGKGLDYCA
jgi:hypothetical protein